MCGRRQTTVCPASLVLRVTNGASSCAERVPWNVLVEHTNLGATTEGRQAGREGGRKEGREGGRKGERKLANFLFKV